MTNWTLWEGDKQVSNKEFVWFETAGTHNMVVKYHSKAAEAIAVEVIENTLR